MLQMVAVCAHVLMFLLAPFLRFQEEHDHLFISQGSTRTNAGKESD